MIEYEIIRSKRKTIALTITKTLHTLVKAPTKMPLKDIETFVNKHSDWIEKHKILVSERTQWQESNSLSEEETIALQLKAKTILPQKVEHYQKIIGVVPTRIKITSATTRWGSCSGKNNLCFSYRLMLLPDEIIDYVVVHELVHIRVKNHSAKFYDEVAKYMPDYKERVKKLKILQKNCQYNMNKY